MNEVATAFQSSTTKVIDLKSMFKRSSINFWTKMFTEIFLTVVSNHNSVGLTNKYEYSCFEFIAFKALRFFGFLVHIENCHDLKSLTYTFHSKFTKCILQNSQRWTWKNLSGNTAVNLYDWCYARGWYKPEEFTAPKVRKASPIYNAIYHVTLFFVTQTDLKWIKMTKN